MKKKIVLIEDEIGLSISLTDLLVDEGFEVEVFEDGETGSARAKSGSGIDLLILDVRLPGKNGFDVCRDLRREGVNVPVLMLTARGQVADRVLGLKLGADDYLVKPFDQLELLARVDALLRRSSEREKPAPTSGFYTFGSTSFDLRSAEVERNGFRYSLSPLEYRLLQFFVKNRMMLIERNRLLDEVWGYNAVVSTRTVDVSVAGLRQKIEPDPKHPKYLITVHGLGYKFVG